MELNKDELWKAMKEPVLRTCENCLYTSVQGQSGPNQMTVNWCIHPKDSWDHANKIVCSNKNNWMYNGHSK